MSTNQSRRIRLRAETFARRVTVDGRLFHPDAPHGTHGGYCNYGCRCKDCTTAQREAVADAKARRRSERFIIDGRLIHPTAPHGSENGYTNYGCRCLPCTEAHRLASWDLAERRQALAGGSDSR